MANKFLSDVTVPDSQVRIGHAEPFTPPDVGDGLTWDNTALTARMDVTDAALDPTYAGIQSFLSHDITSTGSAVFAAITGTSSAGVSSDAPGSAFLGALLQAYNGDVTIGVHADAQSLSSGTSPTAITAVWAHASSDYTTGDLSGIWITGVHADVFSTGGGTVDGVRVDVETVSGTVHDRVVGVDVTITNSGTAITDTAFAAGIVIKDTALAGVEAYSLLSEGVNAVSAFQGALSVGTATPTWGQGALTVHGDMGFTDTASAGLRVLNATTVQRDAFASPAAGQTFFDTTEDNMQYYDGANWVVVDRSALWKFNSLKNQETLGALATKITAIQTTPIKVVVVGDSICLFGWVERMADVLMNVHNPLRSAGVRFPYNNLYYQFVPGAVGTPSSTGASRSSVVLADGQIIEHNPTDKTTSLKILYTRRTDGGNLLVYRDGVLLHTINTNGALAYSQLYETSVGTADIYEWSFEADGGVAQIELVNFMAGNETKGFELWNMSKAGSSLDDVIAYPDASLDGLTTLDPDVVIVALGTNNTADITDNLNDYLDAVAVATPNAIQVVSIPYVSDQFTMTEVEAMRAVAITRQLPMIDFASVIGNYSIDASTFAYDMSGIDNVHPTAHMSQTMGTYAAGIVGCDPNMAAVSSSLQTNGTYRGKVHHIVNSDGVVGGSVEIAEAFGKPILGIKELYSDANYEVILSSSSLLSLLGYYGGGLVIGGGGGDATWSVLYRSGALALKTNSTLDMAANRILDVGTPSAVGDATNKAYVDARSFTKGQSYAIINGVFL